MKTFTIYEAKTNFSKLVEKAKSGTPSYIGAYGKPEVMIVPVPKKSPVIFGLAKNDLAYKDSDLVGADEEIQNLFYGKEA